MSDEETENMESVLTAEDPGTSEDSEPDLDALLAEYEAAESNNEPSPDDADMGPATDTAGGSQRDQYIDPSIDPDRVRMDKLYGWAVQEDQRRRIEQDRAGTMEAIQHVQSEIADLDVQPAPEWIEAALQREYIANEQFRTAYDNREAEPKEWERRLSQATAEFRKHVASMPNPELTADKRAVAAAVVASRQHKDVSGSDSLTEKDLENMPDSEFRKLMQRHS